MINTDKLTEAIIDDVLKAYDWEFQGNQSRHRATVTVEDWEVTYSSTYNGKVLRLDEIMIIPNLVMERQIDTHYV
jgi:hypothetical protein